MDVSKPNGSGWRIHERGCSPQAGFVFFSWCMACMSWGGRGGASFLIADIFGAGVTSDWIPSSHVHYLTSQNKLLALRGAFCGLHSPLALWVSLHIQGHSLLYIHRLWGSLIQLMAQRWLVKWCTTAPAGAPLLNRWLFQAQPPVGLVIQIALSKQPLRISRNAPAGNASFSSSLAPWDYCIKITLGTFMDYSIFISCHRVMRQSDASRKQLSTRIFISAGLICSYVVCDWSYLLLKTPKQHKSEKSFYRMLKKWSLKAYCKGVQRRSKKKSEIPIDIASPIILLQEIVISHTYHQRYQRLKMASAFSLFQLIHRTKIEEIKDYRQHCTKASPRQCAVNSLLIFWSRSRTTARQYSRVERATPHSPDSQASRLLHCGLQ